jgi:hypothetical protein
VALSPVLRLIGITDTVLACGHICLSGLLRDYGFGVTGPNLKDREVRLENASSVNG